MLKVLYRFINLNADFQLVRLFGKAACGTLMEELFDRDGWTFSVKFQLHFCLLPPWGCNVTVFLIFLP